MTDIAIRVQNLSKEYHLGRAQAQHDTLRDALSASFKRLRRRPSPRADQADILWALKDVSFEVQRGEVVGIIGRNGAGKSTLLKILSQITEPTRGRAEIHGRVGSLLEVGTGFHPELTGRENIYLNGAILGMRRHEIERQFDEIVAFAEIERFLDTPVKRYSSGMYVRLAFAVAAHLEPEILLVDEVLAVGDAAFQRKCFNKMGDVTRSGRTVLFVSHNLYAIQTTCERVIWIDSGRTQAEGQAQSVVAKYQKAISIGPQSQERDDRDSPEVQILDLRINGDSSRYLSLDDVFDLKVDWTFRVKTPVTIGLGIGLLSGDGVYISGLGTHLEGNTFHLEPGDYSTGVILPGLHLASGSYLVRISIIDGGGNYLYGYRSPAAVLYVETPFSFDGMLSLEHRWATPERC